MNMKTVLRRPGDQPAVSSKHQVVILKGFCFVLSGGSPRRCVLPQSSQERGCSPSRETRAPAEAEPEQHTGEIWAASTLWKIVGSFSHQGCCNQAAGLWLGEGLFSCCRPEESNPISFHLPSLQPSITSLWTSQWQTSAVPCLSIHLPDLRVRVSPVIHTKFQQYTKSPIIEHLVSPWQTKATSALPPHMTCQFSGRFVSMLHPVRKTAQQPLSKIKQGIGFHHKT